MLVLCLYSKRVFPSKVLLCYLLVVYCCMQDSEGLHGEFLREVESQDKSERLAYIEEIGEQLDTETYVPISRTIYCCLFD